MGATRVLVADPDPATARAVQETLPAPRYDVLSFGDGQEVLRRASEARPDLFILEFNLPKLNSVTVVKSLRTRSEFALTPVLFLADKTTVEPRILGFRIGADDFMPKPIDPLELDLRVTLALKMRQKVERAYRPPPPPPGTEWSAAMTGMRGTLDQIGLPSLMGLLEAERKTGQLVILLEEEQDKARLFFHEGRVLRASRDRKTELRNQELIYALLRLIRGKFDFRPSAVSGADEIRTPTTHLLLEGARRMDEFSSTRLMRPQ